MSDWEPEPTHAIPPAVEKLLVEAKAWSDDRKVQVAGGIPDSRAWMESDIKATEILAQLVEAVEKTWGYA